MEIKAGDKYWVDVLDLNVVGVVQKVKKYENRDEVFIDGWEVWVNKEGKLISFQLATRCVGSAIHFVSTKETEEEEIES